MLRESPYSGCRIARIGRVIAPLVVAVAALSVVAPARANETVARQWNEALLNAIRIDFPAPTVHARNLYHSSAAMWDAWAAYDNQASGVFYTQKEAAGDVGAAREEAISYAAYRVLSERYTHAVDPTASQALFDNVMNNLGYDPSITTTAGSSPAAVGNRIADQILSSTLNDGSNEPNGYVDNTGYAPVNDPMQLELSGLVPPQMNDPNRWQPLAFETRITQNGLQADQVQTYVGPHWGYVDGFALDPAPGEEPWTAHDPGMPPQLGGATDPTFKDNIVSVIKHSAVLDASSSTVPFDFPNMGLNAGDSAMVDISPASRGNRPLGTHNDQGYAVNPATGQPYSPNMVPLGDYGRVIAEFWADGPQSETPPGHWFTLANKVADDPNLEKRIGGSGPVVDDLQWDVSTYMVLGGAVHDAAVSAWGAKRAYDYIRPISMIRYMGSLGQSSDPGGPSYNANGLPLVPGLIEVVTADTAAPGGKHAHLTSPDGNIVGEVAIRAWSGEGEVPEGQVAGTDWIRAVEWWPYQRATFVTPAFAAYVSGHSTFSRAAAEVLAAMTGTPYFPGGMGTYTFPVDEWLEFEEGPSQEITLQWATYFDAADEAGISRLYGGIHVAADDFPGRMMGSQIGQDAWVYGSSFFAVPEPTSAVLLGVFGAGLMMRRKRRAV